MGLSFLTIKMKPVGIIRTCLSIQYLAQPTIYQTDSLDFDFIPAPPPSDIHARWWFTDDEALTAVRLDEAWYLVRTCLCVYIGQEQTLAWQYINHNIYNGK
jgi:hypothetical protein